jgi:apolipoprotein N-acyltransferase
MRGGAAALLGALALALAFPKTGAAPLAPLGAAALFWFWRSASWRAAFWWGWAAGLLFFAINFSWFGYTVGRYVGPFAPAIVLVPAAAEALAFAIAGLGAVLAFRRMPGAVAPLGAACAFTLCEWVRSVGTLGIPFAQLGYSQAETPLAVFAAYAGTYGVTLVVCIIGAYLADAIAARTARRALGAFILLAAAWIICWVAWPARQAPPPSLPVAAVQGDITQSLKWTPGALGLALDRYTILTERAAAQSHPRLIVWPETVITTVLDTQPALMERIALLARTARATLVVGSLDEHGGRYYNALYVFAPTGWLEGIYDKRQLVPFAESVPGRQWLEWLPYLGTLASNFAHGDDPAVFTAAGMRFAPLICWESAFADLAHAQVRRGAQLLVIATDDAWFGTSAGPYQHAQIAQLRAIEEGTWAIRAAATGISGIIAPDGRYVALSTLDTEAIVTGTVGAAPGSFFARIGPTRVMIAIALLYAVLLAAGGSRRLRHASPA